MFPDRCSVTEEGNPCVNPPEFIVSIINDTGQYMIGMTCLKHKQIVAIKVDDLQNKDKIRSGKIAFEALKSVGTDCIRGDPDDLLQIDKQI